MLSPGVHHGEYIFERFILSVGAASSRNGGHMVGVTDIFCWIGYESNICIWFGRSSVLAGGVIDFMFCSCCCLC